MARFPGTEPVQLVSNKLQLWAVICAVQLASRHPAIAGSPTLKIAVEWAREVGAALTSTDNDLRLLMEMGWEKQFDELQPAKWVSEHNEQALRRQIDHIYDLATDGDLPDGDALRLIAEYILKHDPNAAAPKGPPRSGTPSAPSTPPPEQSQSQAS